LLQWKALLGLRISTLCTGWDGTFTKTIISQVILMFLKKRFFFVIFAIPSILLFYFGAIPEINWMFFVGLGILFYGIAYFLVHDVLIHRRFKWFDKTNNWYLRGLRKAHKMHHKHLGKEDGECFGMLFVPLQYFKEQLKIEH
jgi:beta-carotene 3-hydroxylase